MASSTDSGTTRDSESLLDAVLGSSLIVIYLVRASKVVKDSWLGRSARYLIIATRESYFYRWLTTEPEPKVIVIDLRETETVGPIIHVVGWLIELLESIWEGSPRNQE